MLSARNRISSRTDPDINRRIRDKIARAVRYYARRSDEIPARLQALDQEWDIERAIEVSAGTAALAGALLTALGRDRRWLLLSGVASLCLLEHAIEGWCPPVPILRLLGFRTAYEIEEERQALKALRGDFDRVTDAADRLTAAVKAAQT